MAEVNAASEDKEWVWQRVGMGREGQGVRGVDDGQGGGLRLRGSL